MTARFRLLVPDRPKDRCRQKSRKQRGFDHRYGESSRVRDCHFVEYRFDLLPMLAICLGLLRVPRLRAVWWAVVLAVCFAMTGCGGGSGSNSGNGGGHNEIPPGNYTLTLAATSGTNQKNTTVQLIVQ